MLPPNYKAYLFDLDNTLYRETDYLYAAYGKIAGLISEKSNIDQNNIKEFLIAEFEKAGRKDLFDKMILKFNVKNVSTCDCLEILRTVNGVKIDLYADAYRDLVELKSSGKKLCIITNGNVRQQKNKVRLIDWKDLDGSLEFVYSNETERKPSPVSILEHINKNRIDKKDAVFIGDGAEDEQAAKAAGIGFIKSDYKGK